MYLNEYSLLATAVLLITSFFLLFIYRKRTATIAAYRLYELSLLLLIWQFFTWFNWVFRLDKSIHLWTVAFNGFVSTYLGLFFLRFVVSFLEIRFPKSLLQVVWIWTSVCAVFILIGRYVYVDIVLSFWGWSPVYGRWFGLIVGTLLAEMGLSVFFCCATLFYSFGKTKKITQSVDNRVILRINSRNIY